MDSLCAVLSIYLTSTLFISVESNSHNILSLTCKESEYICHNHNCVPMSNQCDGKNDCKDNSDELDCDLIKCRTPNYFQCSNARCISSSFVCDGENDCEDFSDEFNCTNFKYERNVTCDKNQWKCTDNLCIPKEWVCNGQSDCLDGSDELLGCSSTSECDGFRCKNGHCIFNEWKCDGQDDCRDNSDETDCGNIKSIEFCEANANYCMCANNKTCIKSEAICDGHYNCPDKSDEGTFCRNFSLHNSYNSCSHQCVLRSQGPKCLCHKGYNETSESNCEDLNECNFYGICDQKCKNTYGSYECECDEDYILQEDKKTCKAIYGEATLLFSSKNEIRAFLLKSKKYFSVAKDLNQVVGIDYDGYYVYWTDIFSEHESLIRAQITGEEKEVLVTSGLGAPEDLKVDHFTGNVYFTDAERQHIAVCTNNGINCLILIDQDVNNKPRSIVLHPQEGEMYWSDWGKIPNIAKSLMDGSENTHFVSENIHWPNGLALDFHNKRLYWTDAKLMTLESIRLDGTDRKVVLAGIVKHPYAISVFENRLYWSDWATHSIESCNKFTGKEHETLITENKEFIYGITIYHESLRRNSGNHSCSWSPCSDICLLKGPHSYTCGCPQGKILNIDRHTCKYFNIRQMLLLSVNNLLVKIEHQLLGKHDMKKIPIPIKKIGALTYNRIQNIVYLSDNEDKKIFSLDMNSEDLKVLPIYDVENIVAMDYDFMGRNLYFCDIEKGTVEAVNINSMSKRTLLYGLGIEVPVALALVPEEGVFFVALKQIGKAETHIDRILTDGSNRSKVIIDGLVGPVNLVYDDVLQRVFIADGSTGNIESTNIEGDDRHGFLWLHSSPIAIASLKNDIFWMNKGSKRLYWSEKLNSENGYVKRIALDLPEVNNLRLISITPKDKIPLSSCQVNNGNCSDLCFYINKTSHCGCPVGWFLESNNHSCTKAVQCRANEFYCSLSNFCILSNKRCDGTRDCVHGEDEAECLKLDDCLKNSPSNRDKCGKVVKNNCPLNHFQCENGECIQDTFVCDTSPDCSQGEDELHCISATCAEDQFRCQSGACIPKRWECDGEYDCLDFSDEHGSCELCKEDKFPCNNGKCIDKSLKCNRQDDCGDFSDEQDCLKTNLCPEDYFECASNVTICLPHAARCNKTSECPHHEDEQNCSNCHVDEFTCKNNKCIPTQWICDKFDDCGDDSDEDSSLCGPTYRHETNILNNSSNKFCCNDNQCIEYSLVCNGELNCYDGSDENGACNTSCIYGHNPCSQICRKTPTGSICDCYKGYKLNADNKSCDDINECEQNPCSQICHNVLGSHSCECFEGFVLKRDKKTCKALGLPMSIFYTHGSNIEQLHQSRNIRKLVHTERFLRITGFDADIISNFIYFTTEFSNRIYRINLLNSSHHYISVSGEPIKITVDWVTENIFFVNRKDNDTSINVCNFEENPSCIKLVTVDDNRHVTSLALDAIHQTLFYSEVNWIHNSPTYVIYKINLKTENNFELIKNSTGYVSGLTYNSLMEELFYVDQYNGELKKIKYDGTGALDLIKNLHEPRGLRFFEDSIYFVTKDYFMNKCKLFDIESCLKFKLEHEVTDFVLFQETVQPESVNQCANHTCRNLCISTLNDFKCICENRGLLDDSIDCLKEVVQIREEYSTKEDNNPGYLSYRRSEERPLVMGFLLSFSLLIFGVLCYILFFRKKSRSFQLGIRFHNPVYGLHINEPEGVNLNPGQHEYQNPMNSCEDVSYQQKKIIQS